MADNPDLARAVKALTAKQRQHDLWWRYYDGQAPLVYNNEKLREIFRGLDARFTENWCAVVVDSVLDRLELRPPVVTDAAAPTTLLADLWAETGLADDEYSVHEDVAVTGEAFVIAWPDDAGAVQAFHNDARLCHVEYDAENPRRMRYAAKWWQADDGRLRLTLYYPDRLEYYATRQPRKESATTDARAFAPWGDAPTAANPFGHIPVFHFRSRRRQPRSQLANVVEIQDAVNKLLADMMVAAEFGAFMQRWVISQNGVGKLRNSPNEIWDLPAGEAGMQATSVGQFAPTPLDNYLTAINKLAADIGVISRTPRYYFYAQGGDPSGEALAAMTAPLTRKVQRVQATLVPTWRDLARFLLRLRGVDVPPRAIWTPYEAADTVPPLMQAQLRKLGREAGLPLRTVLKLEGWTDDDLAELDADLEAERVQERAFADAVLTAAQRDFDRGEA